LFTNGGRALFGSLENIVKTRKGKTRTALSGKTAL